MGGGGGADLVSAVCNATIATYSHRVDNHVAYNWCVVPSTSFDVILFACIAVGVACVSLGKFATTIVLLMGGALMAIATPVNLGRISNSIAWWLAISPYQLFFYVFLPPLLLEAAVRINFFMFKKVAFQVVTLAYLVVIFASALLIPIFLYVFDLKKYGWNWAAAAMYGAMVASTDAVAIISTMKTSGASSRLRVILEGESLFNDASSFTLFHIYLEKVEQLAAGQHHYESTAELIGHIASRMVWMAVGGSLVGLAFGMALHRILAWLRTKDAHIEQQVALTLATGYLAFYVAESPIHVSGVVSIAAFGLYGAYSQKWGMSRKVEESGAFDAFWDTVCYVMNAIVFFFSGVSCCNFFWRSIEELLDSGEKSAVIKAVWMLPIVYVTMFILRFLLTALFQPLLFLTGQAISMKETGFIAMAGVRGSVSLILAQAVISDLNSKDVDKEGKVVRAQIVFWTAGFVLLTLLINGPLLPTVLKLLGLNHLHKRVLQRRAKAVQALEETTQSTLDTLRQDSDEMLTSVDWTVVEQAVDVASKLRSFYEPPSPPDTSTNTSTLHRLLISLCSCFSCFKQANDDSSQPSASPPASPTHHTNSSSLHFTPNPVLPKLATTSQNSQWDAMDKHLGRPSNSRIAAYVSHDGAPRGIPSRTSEERPPGGHLGRHSPLLATTSLKPYFNPVHPDFDFLMDEVPFAHPSSHAPALIRHKSGPLNDDDDEAGGARPESKQRRSSGATVRDTKPVKDDVNQAAPPRHQQVPIKPPLPNGPQLATTAARGRSTPSLATLSNNARAAYEQTPSPRSPRSNPTAKSRLGTTAPAVLSDDHIFGKGQAPRGLTNPNHSLQHLKASKEAGSLSLSRASELLIAAAESGDGSSTRSPRSAAAARQVTWGQSFSDDQDEEGGRSSSPVDEAEDDDLINMRMTLLAGVRQYCQTKRLEGLLSANALRTIETAVESALEAPEEPLNMWAVLEQESCNRIQLVVFVSVIQAFRKVSLAYRRHFHWTRKVTFLRPLYWLFRQPLDLPVQLGMGFLNRTMLLSCELAITYVMALTNSSFSTWLRETEASPDLLEELKWEGQQAVQFIVDREIEAPERFSAIQSYRATMAVLKRQREFLKTLLQSGVLNQAEHSTMMHPIDKVERRLEAKGPTWRAPVVKEVLSNLPFLRGQPKEVLELFLRNGRLTVYENGSEIEAASRICVVVSGLVKITYDVLGTSSPEYFLGTGGMFGIWGALTRHESPWKMSATAAGNAVGKGPVLFIIGDTAVGLVRQLALMGDEMYIRVEQDMFRLAALYAVDRLKSRLLENWAQQITRAEVIKNMDENELEEVLGGTEGMLPDAGYLRLVLARRVTAELLNDLKDELTRATMVSLKPGQYVLQRFHFCLITGSLTPQPLGTPDSNLVDRTDSPAQPTNTSHRVPSSENLTTASSDSQPSDLTASSSNSSHSSTAVAAASVLASGAATRARNAANTKALGVRTAAGAVTSTGDGQGNGTDNAPGAGAGNGGGTFTSAAVLNAGLNEGDVEVGVGVSEIGESWVPPRLQPWFPLALENTELISARDAEEAPPVKLVAGANGALLLCCAEGVEVLGSAGDEDKSVKGDKEPEKPAFSRTSLPVQRKNSRRASLLGIPQRPSDNNEQMTCTSNFGHGLTSSFADQMKDAAARPTLIRPSSEGALAPMRGPFWRRTAEKSQHNNRKG